ncbi:MAG: hypothetical protein M3Z08_09030 [Chloroflexota bacterium]|nr:hypothetical protein [Chloroflexota bacterium]
MNTETKDVTDFLSIEGTHADIFTIVQEAPDDEQAAQQIQDYVLQQRKGPPELYQHFEQGGGDLGNVDWVVVAQAFKSD